jgi:hypothetical protein
MKNIINLVSCVSCNKVGIHWLCSTCEKRQHHPSVYMKIVAQREKLDSILKKSSI